MAALGVLTGGIAHNINNLLGVVVGNLELLRERAPQDAESAEYTREALEAALSGAELVRGMLAFARQQPLRRQRIDINELVSDVVNILGRLLGEDVEVSLHLGDEVWPVMTDPAQLEASIMNLAVNAREAMPRGRRLSISTPKPLLGRDGGGRRSSRSAGGPCGDRGHRHRHRHVVGGHELYLRTVLLHQGSCC